MGDYILGETADLFERSSGRWVGVLDKNGKEQLVTQYSKPRSYRRAPSVRDNAASGYTASSVWQYNGSVYQPTAAPDTTAATWLQQQPTGAAPCDVMGVSAICAGGVVAMKAGFTGPAITLTATVSSSPVTTDINILAGGELDVDAVRKVFASADAGTQIYVTKIFDQSGGAKHLTMITSAGKITRGFYLVWDVLMNRYVIAADQGYGTDGQGLAFDATMSVQETSMSAFFFGRGVGSQGDVNSQIVATFGTGATALSIHTGEGSVGPTLAAWNGASRRPVTANQCTPLDCKPCVAWYVGGASSVAMGVNEDSYTAASALSTARTGGYLGNWDLASGKFPAMRFVGFAIANANATAVQQTKIRNWFYTKFDALPQARDRVVFVGDSRGTLVYSNQNATSASIGQFGANIGVQLAEKLSADCQVVNASSSGWTNADHAAKSIPGLVATVKSGVGNVAVVLIGVNDFIVSNLTAAQSFTALNANISALKTAGYYTIVVAELRCVTATNGANTKTDELHTLINSGACLADEVVDVWGLTPIASPSNSAYYPDGLHPNGPVCGLIAAAVSARVDSVLRELV